MALEILLWDAMGWLLGLGGPGLLLLGLVHSFFPIPGGMDVAIVLLSAHKNSFWWYYATMALTGDATGAYLNYRVARKGGKEAVQKKISRPKAEKAFHIFEKYGGWGLLVGAWIPPPMPWIPFLAAAGALQYPIRKFMAVITVGRGIRYFALAWVGHRYGTWIISVVTSYRQEILYALIALGVAIGLGLLVFFKWYLPRQKRKSGPSEQAEEPQSGDSDEAQREAAEPDRKAG